MKLVLYSLLLAFTIVFTSCKPKKNIPDVSNIQVHLTVKRFETDLFKVDTNNITAGLDSLSSKYPLFTKDYLYGIQAFPQNADSITKYMKAFLTDGLYQNIKVTAASTYTTETVNSIKDELELSLKYVKYYFPAYRLPNSIITFIGPIEGTANALTYDGIAVGLQGYLGRNYPAYQNQYISQVYPAYKTRRFEKEYIVVNSVRNIIEDIYPPRNSGKNLIEQMIDLGKRMYLTDILLPAIDDTLKIGYTENQLKDCYSNEKNIWSFFAENNLLFQKEPNLIAPYLNDGPNTPELGNSAPGFIGQFIGWQIVKQWCNKYPKTTIADLLSTNEMQIFNEAKYKP